MKIKGDVFRRKFQKAGIGKTDVVNDYFHHDYEDTSGNQRHNVPEDHVINAEVRTERIKLAKTGIPFGKDGRLHPIVDTSAVSEVYDNKSLGEQMRFKLQLLVELNNAQRHDMANDVLLELYDMCDQVINVCPARKMGSLSDLI